METESIESDVAKPARWIAEGLRAALFLRPDLRGLRATPGLLAAMCVLLVAFGIGVQRLSVQGPALFYWQSSATGWLGPLITLWVCWIVVRQAAAHDAAPAVPAPPVGVLFALLLAQSWVVTAIAWAVYLMLDAMGGSAEVRVAMVWIAPVTMVWTLVAAARLLWRHAPGAIRPRGLMLAALVGGAALGAAAPATPYWYPDPAAGANATASSRYRLTQEDFEIQGRALADQVTGLAPQREGVIDLYALTVAPYASQDVFLRESDMVAEVMRTRFDAAGRVLQLGNQPGAKGRMPWATPQNLQRAIAAAARAMNRDEDILFIHLTSHGARDGKLSVSFWPLHVDDLTAVQLKQWLDAAGIRFRVISVSACYSGTWLAPLEDEHTLVMTAADAEHTSYGCGQGSELTYFGRAVFDEQLREAPSFEAAVARARPIIQKREAQAGKSDGFSNPQIRIGAAVRAQLARLEARLAPLAQR